jgi:hypothetical protein
MAPIRVVLAVTLVLCLTPAPALSQITPIANPQGFSSSVTLVTFEGQGSRMPPVISSLGGVSFSSSYDYMSLGNDGDPRPFGPDEGLSVDNRGASEPVTLRFASPITRLAFVTRINGCNQRATVQFFSGAASVGSGQSGPSQPVTSDPRDTCSPGKWIWVGFESAQPFDRVVINAPTNGYASLDNIRFESVAPPPPPPPVVVTPMANPSAFSASATLVTFQNANDITVSSMSGATFSAGSQNYVSVGMDPAPRPFGPADPKTIDNRPGFSQPITIAFAAPATKLAFEVSHNGCAETVLVEFLAGTNVIGSGRTPASAPGSNCSPGGFVFGGFQLSAPFDRVRITGPVNGYLRIDNVRFER